MSTAVATTSTASKQPFNPTNTSSKKLKHKGSKPIFNWITKRLAGTSPRGQRQEPPPPLPTLPNTQQRRQRTLSLRVYPTHQAHNTIILNDEELSPNLYRTRSYGSSAVAESIWAPSQAHEADDDASIRPLPPTSPPSPVPSRMSRSSSSHLSDPRTFRSGAASTKPTTVMSFDSGHGGNGVLAGTMAHIAQAPNPTNAPAPSNSRLASPPIHPAVVRAASQSQPHGPVNPSSVSRGGVQAPFHTFHHPRYNPNPSAPPLDNASTLTLASSAFAHGRSQTEWGDGVSLSVSYHFQGDLDANSSHLELDDADDGEQGASIRALRPRSSRRGSWDSLESRWSARVGGQGTTPPSIASGINKPASVGGTSIAGLSLRAAKPSTLDKTDELDASSVSDSTVEDADMDNHEARHEKPEDARSESSKTTGPTSPVGQVPIIAVESYTPPPRLITDPIQASTAVDHVNAVQATA